MRARMVLISAAAMAAGGCDFWTALAYYDHLTSSIVNTGLIGLGGIVLTELPNIQQFITGLLPGAAG